VKTIIENNMQNFFVNFQSEAGERRIEHLEKELQQLHSRYTASAREVIIFLYSQVTD
jgi:hypothetical protein